MITSKIGENAGKIWAALQGGALKSHQTERR